MYDRMLQPEKVHYIKMRLTKGLVIFVYFRPIAFFQIILHEA